MPFTNNPSKKETFDLKYLKIKLVGAMSGSRCKICSENFMSWSRAIVHVKTRHFYELSSTEGGSVDCYVEPCDPSILEESNSESVETEKDVKIDENDAPGISNKRSSDRRREPIESPPAPASKKARQKQLDKTEDAECTFNGDREVVPVRKTRSSAKRSAPDESIKPEMLESDPFPSTADEEKSRYKRQRHPEDMKGVPELPERKRMKKGKSIANNNATSNKTDSESEGQIDEMEVPVNAVTIEKPSQKRTRKSKLTVNKTSSGVEIKLDSLKASEIEALMSQMCSGPGPSLVSNTRRQRQAAFAANQILLADDQEEDNVDEEPKTVYLRKRKPDDEDEDYTVEDGHFNKEDELEDNASKKKNITSKPLSGAGRRKHRGKRPEIRGPNTVGKQKCPFNCIGEYECSKEFFAHMKSAHMKVTSDGKRYECALCSKTFPDRFGVFNKHLREEHDKAVDYTKVNFYYSYDFNLTCKVCGKKSMYEAVHKAHEEMHKRKADDAERTFKCPLCHCKFLRRDSVQRHFLLHLTNNPFVCKVPGCSAKFTSAEHLNRHIALHSGHKHFKCDKCEDKQFTRLDHLKRHINTQHGGDAGYEEVHKKISKRVYVKRLSPCESSNDNENDKEIRLEGRSLDLTDHIVTADGSDVHLKGEILEASNYDFDDSPIQIKQEEGSKKPIDLLGLLQNQDNVRINLRSDILADPVYQKLLKDDPEGAAMVIPSCNGYRMYGRAQALKCPHCDWVGIRGYSLQEHLKKVHKEVFLDPKDGEAPILLCGSCGFQSSSPEELSAHMDKNHNDKPDEPSTKYFCDICGDGLKTRLGLTAHRNIKHPETKDPNAHKAFKCLISNCSQAFTSEYALRKHKFNHDGEDRTACKICGQVCATKHTLKRHIDYVHLKKPNPYKKKKGATSQTLTEAESDADPSSILGI